MLQAILGLGSSVVTAVTEKQQAKHKRELAIIDNEARLALSENEANSAWEMAQLQDKDKFLRWFSYSMFTAPILVTVISPEHGKQIFENLEHAPSWLVEVFIALNGAVWGLSSLKNVVPSIVGQIKGNK